MSRDAIASHFQAHYRPPKLVMAAAGNLHHDELAGAIERRMSPAPTDLPARRPSAPARPRTEVVSTRPTEQAHVVVGMQALSRADDDRFAFSVLNQVLGGGMMESCSSVTPLVFCRRRRPAISWLSGVPARSVLA